MDRDLQGSVFILAVLVKLDGLTMRPYILSLC